MLKKLRQLTKRSGSLRKVIWIFCLIFASSVTVFAQTVVKGKITDAETGESLPGVNILVKGTNLGVISDFDGNYQIAVNDPQAVLSFSFMGYKTQDIPVESKTSINVSLETSSSSIDEIVIVGYGTAKRSDLTGSIATISSRDLKNVPVTNTAEALKGRLPGVNITSVDGSPDAEIIIRVRGGGSITQDNSPLIVVDDFIVESIRDVPVNDIADISVLKDATATAIYGAQGANGVILIKTKNPVAGKTTVTYNGYADFKVFPDSRKYDVLSPYEFVMANYEKALLGDDEDMKDFTKYYGNYSDLELYKNIKGTDWQEELFGNPQISQSHSLSINGGTAITKMNLSFTNNKDEGILKGSGYERTSVNFKINHELSKNITLDASARISNIEVNGAGTAGGSQLRIKNIVTRGPVNGIADQLDIDLSDVNPDDDYQTYLLKLIDPRELVKQDWRKRNTRNYILNSGITWKPVKNLNLRSSFTTSTEYDKNQRYYGPLTSESKQEGNNLPLGVISENNNVSYRWYNTALYEFSNLGLHKLSILVGHEISSNGGTTSSSRAEDFRSTMDPETLMANFELGTPIYSNTSDKAKKRQISGFGKINYSLMDRYLLDATIRADASSIFKKGNRLGVFPAAAAAWKISEEDFLKNVEKIDLLKLRVSYGESGNNRIDALASKFLFEPKSGNNSPGMGTNQYNAYYGPAGTVLYNPDIIWETTTSLNFGTDLSMFNSRLNASIDIYSNKTKDLLLKNKISQVSGFSEQWDNIGSTSNKGIDLLVSGIIIDKKDLTLTVNMNLGTYNTKIEDLGNVTERWEISNWASTSLKDIEDYYLKVGESLGLIYGYVTDGYYTEDDFESYNEITGKYVLKDSLNGEVIPDCSGIIGQDLRPGYLKLKNLDTIPGTITSTDRTVIGNAIPDLTGGFGIDLQFKGFDFSAFFNFSVGNDVYNAAKIEYDQMYRTSDANMLSTMSLNNRYSYVDIDGSITGIPGGLVTDLEQLRTMNANKNIWSHTSFGDATVVLHSWAIEDGSFLRLQTMTLGYSLPGSILNKIKISQLRFYVTGRNLWIWTKYSGYDPEVSTSRSSTYNALTPGLDYSSYPKSRSYICGVNVTF